LLKDGDLVIAMLKLIIGYARKYMVNMVQADVSGKPLQNFG
jgi:hypothetical protein